MRPRIPAGPRIPVQSQDPARSQDSQVPGPCPVPGSLNPRSKDQLLGGKPARFTQICPSLYLGLGCRLPFPLSLSAWPTSFPAGPWPGFSGSAAHPPRRRHPQHNHAQELCGPPVRPFNFLPRGPVLRSRDSANRATSENGSTYTQSLRVRSAEGDCLKPPLFSYNENLQAGVKGPCPIEFHPSPSTPPPPGIDKPLWGSFLGSTVGEDTPRPGMWDTHR